VPTFTRERIEVLGPLLLVAVGLGLGAWRLGRRAAGRA
jgi:hypothetical protein